MHAARANIITNVFTVELHMNPGFWNILRPFRCRLTLRGVIVTDPRPAADEWRGVVIPWEQTFRSVAMVEDRSSGKLKCIALALTNTRVSRTAHRLRERACDRAWREGSLVVREDYSSQCRQRWHGWAILIIMYCIMIPYAAWFMMRGQPMPPTLPPGIIWLFWLALSGTALTYFVMLTIVPIPAAYATCRHNVRLAKLNTGGIEASLLDGRILRARWRDLSRFMRKNGLWTAEWPGGEVVRFYSPRVSAVVLRRIMREREPDYEQRIRRKSNRSMARGLLWFILGGITGGWMVWYLQNQGLMPGTHRLAPLFFGLMVGIGVPGALALQVWMQTKLTRGLNTRNRKRV